MSKFLSLGVPLAEVIKMSTRLPPRRSAAPIWATWASAPGPIWPCSHLRTGDFGFLDVRNLRRSGSQRLECELTLREGRVVFDRDGRAAAAWRCAR